MFTTPTTLHHRTHRPLGTALVAAAFSAVTFVAPASWAQNTTGSTSTAQGSGSMGAAPASRSATSNNTANTTAGSRVTEDDREMMQDLAHANLAEIETGRLAVEKAQNAEVKKFAQQMIDDHSKSLQELQRVAQAKGVELPKETDFAHKAMATALKALTGGFFDKQYMQHAGVGDHRRTVDLLQKVQQNARDQELKAYASKTLPAVQRHLTMARELEKKV
jgi:putative membrane protein